MKQMIVLLVALASFESYAAKQSFEDACIAYKPYRDKDAFTFHQLGIVAELHGEKKKSIPEIEKKFCECARTEQWLLLIDLHKTKDEFKNNTKAAMDAATKSMEDQNYTVEDIKKYLSFQPHVKSKCTKMLIHKFK